MALEIQQKRNTAYKVWIGDLLRSNVSLSENKLNYVEIGNKRLVRINIIANVIDKYQHNEKPYASLTLDDSSGQIRAKTFDSITNLTSFNIGDSVRVIGTLRYFNNELYIQPEIIKKVYEKWLLVRKFELGEPLRESQTESVSSMNADITPEIENSLNSYSKFSAEKMKVEKIEDINQVQDTKKTLFLKISENPEGIDIDNLIISMNFPVAEINSSVTELIEEGKIYEPQPGKLRSI